MNTSADSAAHSGPSDPRRAPKTWGFWLTLAWALGAAAVLFVSQGIVAVILVIATRRAHPEQPFGIEQIVANGPLIAWTIIVSTPFLVAFLALATRRAHRSLIDYLGLKWPGWPQTLLGFLALAGVLALVALAETFAKVDTPAFMTDTFKSAKDMGELPLVAFAFVLAAPFSEEILFRGFLFRGFAEREKAAKENLLAEGRGKDERERDERQLTHVFRALERVCHECRRVDLGEGFRQGDEGQHACKRDEAKQSLRPAGPFKPEIID